MNPLQAGGKVIEQIGEPRPGPGRARLRIMQAGPVRFNNAFAAHDQMVNASRRWRQPCGARQAQKHRSAWFRSGLMALGLYATGESLDHEPSPRTGQLVLLLFPRATARYWSVIRFREAVVLSSWQGSRSSARGYLDLPPPGFSTRRHDITVYEKEPRVGGHTRTLHVRHGDRTIPVDTGFIVYNERNYPNLTALFRHLRRQIP